MHVLLIFVCQGFNCRYLLHRVKRRYSNFGGNFIPYGDDNHKYNSFVKIAVMHNQRVSD